MVDAAVARLVGFGRYLRGAGLPVGTNRILTFCRSVGLLTMLEHRGPRSAGSQGLRERVYWAGLSSLVAHPDHFETYERAFREYFGGSLLEETLSSLLQSGDLPDPRVEIEILLGNEEQSLEQAEESDDSDESVLRMIAAGTEVLRNKTFDDMTEEERLHADRLIRRLVVMLPLRRSRRLHRAAKGARFDLRRTLRSSLRTQGEPFARAWLSRRHQPRPLVLLLDISGSMSPYARALMQFGYAAMSTGQRVEVFCFGTRLTRVTRALRTKDPDRALNEVAATVLDWEGGTRIGESLKSLLDDYSQAAALKGAVVVLCSDGLERGDPEVLSTQMARLHRIAHQVIWVNPLKGSPRYEPLARGMRSALPHVDRFLAGHNVASLDALCEALVT